MSFFKSVRNNYIIGVGIGNVCEEITEAEYNSISEIMHNIPTAADGYRYRLRADTLEWELYELPEPINEETSTDDYEQTLNGLGG